MKKYINKLVFAGLLAVLGLTACNQDNESAMPNAEVTAAAYSMFQPNLVAELLPENNGILNVVITRTNADSDATVPVEITGTAATLNLFSLASSEAKFEKGQAQSVVKVAFNLSALSASGSYSFSVGIQNADLLSKGGSKTTAVTAARKLTWKSIGTGTWLFSSTFGVAPEDNEPVGVQQAIEAPEMYRLVEFFSKPILMTISSSNVASISLQATGVTSSGRELVMNCTGTYNPATKIIEFPRVNAAYPQNYYYYLNGTSYTAGWYLEERIKLP